MRVLVLLHHDLLPPEKPLKVETISKASWYTEYSVIKALRHMGHEVFPIGVADDLKVVKQAVDDFRPHLVFNLLEEFAGQAIFDQNVVSYLELLGVKYSGCNPRGLILARDKALAKKVLAFHGIPSPDFFVIRRKAKVKIPRRLDYPLFIKTLNEEASLGITQKSIVWDEKKLRERAEYIFDEFKTDVLAETYVKGREFYVSMLGNDRLQVFPTWELFFERAPERMARIYTRNAKWSQSYRTKFGIRTGPAEGLSKDLENRIQKICRNAYSALQLNGYARMDLRVSDHGQIFLIEVNPNPDIADREDFAQSAQAGGVSYSQLLSRIMRLALAWSPLR